MARSFASLLPVLLVLAVSLSACDSGGDDDLPPPPPPPPPATTGSISGQIGLVPGVPGSVSNTRMALYTSIDDLINDRVVYQTAADGSGNYTISNIVPGTYYIDAWKDNDGSGTVNGPDLYGFYQTTTTSGSNPSPLPIGAGTSQTISFTIQSVGGPAATGKPTSATQ